jgi:hypothetical protein
MGTLNQMKGKQAVYNFKLTSGIATRPVCSHSKEGGELGPKSLQMSDVNETRPREPSISLTRVS